MNRRAPARSGAQVLLLSGALFACLAARAQDAPGEISEGIPADPTLMLGKTPFTIQGFGDFDYIARAAEGEHSGFRNGAFEFVVSSRLSDHWTALGELVFEPDGNTLSTDLERFQLTYEMSDAFRISAGRVHNPILRWSVTNHHGLFMQTTINNPIIARWEDHNGLWPLHFVGAMASGRLPGSLGLIYWVGAGNGRGTVRDEVQVGSDANGSKAYVTSVGVAPDAIPGFQAFASAYFDSVPAPSGELRERDVTLSLSYIRGAAELRAEWSHLQHTPRGGASLETRGWYILASHGLSGPLKGFRPYALLEALDVADGEAYLDGIPSEKGVSVGLRYDVNRWLALKGEVRSQRVGDGPRASVVGFQLAANF